MGSSFRIPRMIHKMAGKAVGIVQILAEKAVDKVTEQLIDFGFDLGKDCIDLNNNMQSLERKLEILSSQESDIKQQLEQCELSGKKKRKREVENWLGEVKEIRTEIVEFQRSAKKGFLRNLLCGDHVEKLDRRVVELTEQRQNFNELLRDDLEYRGDHRLTGELFGEMFNQNLRSINECLTTDNIRRIGIHGIGGVGKTMLAKHINNHLLDNTRDFKVCWLTVSRDLSIKMLQDKIAKAIYVDLSELDDEETRAVILSGKLMQMDKFVLFLDDLQKGFCLQKLLGNPPVNEGCRLILITHSSQLCRQMNCERVFQVETLNPEEAWELFEHVLGQDTVLPTEVKEIAKAVTNRCAGLPLRIITEAGRMKGVQDICEWRNTLEELKTSSMEHDHTEQMAE